MKSFLYGLVAIGLFLNIWTNIATYRQSKISIENGEIVTRSLKVLQAIDSVKLSIHNFQKNELASDSIYKKIQELTELLHSPDLKAQAVKLSTLSPVDLSQEKHNLGFSALSEMEAEEKSLIDEREVVAHLSDVKALRRVVYSGCVDFALLLIIFISFLYEKKLAFKVQKALNSTLSHVENVNHTLKTSLLQKESVLKTTVHDLKNPLGSIRGFAEILAEEANGNRSVLEMTQTIQRISNNALALVGSLLDTASGVKNNTENHENVKILDILNEICKFLDPILRKKGQKIEFEKECCDFLIVGNSRQIQDIFYNILGNASKFSPIGSVLRIGCSDAEKFYEVEIKDEGPGFTEADFSKMFLPGAKLSALPTGSENSTGIGLYSVKKTLENIGGSIEVSNNSDRGACVKIRFPRLVTAANQSQIKINDRLL